MASSRQFVWVTVNRDRTPDIPKQYAVSAYPTLLTVGPNNEKIHRFQSFQKPPEFLASLNIGFHFGNIKTELVIRSLLYMCVFNQGLF